MTPETPIKLDLTLAKVNILLQALAAQPYAQVADLIAELRQQAEAQIAAKKVDS